MARGWPKGKPRGSRKIHTIEQLAPIVPPTEDEMLNVVFEGSRAKAEAEGLGGYNPPPIMGTREQILAGLIEPPPNYRKAADYQLGKGPWEIMRCRECNAETYTRDPVKQDVCENCLWELTQQLAEVERVRILRNTDRMLNPFKSVNPFSELTGSLPSVKK